MATYLAWVYAYNESYENEDEWADIRSIRYIQASDDREARDVALVSMGADYPPSAGWTGHDATVFPITSTELEEMLEFSRKDTEAEADQA